MLCQIVLPSSFSLLSWYPWFDLCDGVVHQLLTILSSNTLPPPLSSESIRLADMPRSTMTLHPSTNLEEALWITYEQIIPTETLDSGPSHWGDLCFPSHSGNTVGSASSSITSFSNPNPVGVNQHSDPDLPCVSMAIATVPAGFS